MSKLFKSGKTFKAKDHDEMGSFDALPVGEYTARITGAEMKENSKKTGSFLSLKFKITEGKFKDRLLFSNLNLDHPNDDAVAMAEKELATICKSLGLAGVEDTNDLLGQDELVLKVIIKKATSQYPEGNEIKNYKSVDGVAKPSRKNDDDDDEPVVKKKKPKVSFD